MICADCHQEITDDRSQDNRFRGCDVCGWRMHHSCWNEALALSRLPCPTEVELVEVRRWEDIGGVTPVTGKPRRRSYTVEVERTSYLPDHGCVIGMRGEWNG